MDLVSPLANDGVDLVSPLADDDVDLVHPLADDGVEVVSPLADEGEVESTMSSPVPISPFNCEICGRGFKGKQGFRLHTANKIGNPKCYKSYKKMKKEESEVTEDSKQSRKRSRAPNKAYEDIEEVKDDPFLKETSSFLSSIREKPRGDPKKKRRSSFLTDVAVALKHKTRK